MEISSFDGAQASRKSRILGFPFCFIQQTLKLIFTKQHKVVSWIFDVTIDALLLAVTQKNSITRHLFTLYGGRFSVNHDVVRIWVMLKIKGKYKQQKILIVKYRKAVFSKYVGASYERAPLLSRQCLEIFLETFVYIYSFLEKSALQQPISGNVKSNLHEATLHCFEKISF